MNARFQTIAFVVVLLGATLLLITPGAGKGIERAIDPGVTLRVQGVGVTGKPEPWLISADALQRAHTVASGQIPLGPNSLPGGYTPTSSGFISFVWQLPHSPELDDPSRWSTVLRSRYASEVPHAMLQPGDILANLRTGQYGHAIVFERWSQEGQARYESSAADGSFEEGVRFLGFEVDRFVLPARVAEREYTLGYLDGALTILELDRELHGPYSALRYNGIPGYVSLIKSVNVQTQPIVGAGTVSSFVLVNRGGTSVRLTKVGVVAYGPSALEHGVAGTPQILAQINDVMLAPGQVYAYNQSHIFQQAGTYVALPRYEVDGVLFLPLTPTYFQVKDR